MIRHHGCLAGREGGLSLGHCMWLVGGGLTVSPGHCTCGAHICWSAGPSRVLMNNVSSGDTVPTFQLVDNMKAGVMVAGLLPPALEHKVPC